ncbi:hypothetical protein V22_32680 [Calycomorphotria hydatis]|uniref:Uncharacterized protein n=1 Tax=Calycomorphotria hydatis TaxID=2528027 RepID=A0A517TCA2_9PLAN|nr:hypothetical protein V22_32680 [Calycomorphotria hydatis]
MHVGGTSRKVHWGSLLLVIVLLWERLLHIALHYRLLTILLIASILIFIIYFSRRYFEIRKLKRTGRWMEWSELEQKLTNGHGVTIINWGNTIGRVWWAEELSDEYVAYMLATSAHLTNCPWYKASAKTLQKDFSHATIIETSESAMS